MERWRGGEGGIRWLMEITVNSTSKTSNCFLWKHSFIYKMSSLSLQTQHIKGFCIYSTHHMYKNIYVWHFSCMSRNHVTRVANYQVWFEFNLPNVSKENSPLQCMRIEIRIFKSQLFGGNTTIPCFTKRGGGVDDGGQYTSTPQQTQNLRLDKKPIPFSSRPLHTSYKMNYLAGTDLRLKLDFKLERFPDCQCNFWTPLSPPSATRIHSFTSFKSETSQLK